MLAVRRFLLRSLLIKQQQKLLLQQQQQQQHLHMTSQQCSISDALKNIREKIETSHKKYCEKSEKKSRTPCLVAVSKTKPTEAIQEAYAADQRDFGENYVQELVQKSHHFKELGGYDDIRWHFIGHLQRNKVNNLLGAVNLHVIETVESIKLADAINKRWETLQQQQQQQQQQHEERRLKVYAQVNTSGEQNKHGCKVEECSDLVEHIVTKCPSLQLEGLMTIGSFDHDYNSGPNPDFMCLVKCREEVCQSLDLKEEDLQLSMGMSNDFQQAIMSGSTTVRVGSSIFGVREYKVT